MRKNILLLAGTAVLLSCNAEDMTTGDSAGRNPVFRTSFEEIYTRTAISPEGRLFWHENDLVSVFTSTCNRQYRFDGSTGATDGSFSAVPGGSSADGDVTETNYSVYPYSAATSITGSGVISLKLPSTQEYAEGSFGRGANTMVAVTGSKDDRLLSFMNLCGYVIVNLYGNTRVRQVTLYGNGGEKIAGSATVRPMPGEQPAVSMTGSAKCSITMDCGDGVTLGTDIGSATEFWFAVPPVEFGSGFTIEVVAANGSTRTLTTAISRTVSRNTPYSLGAMEINLGTDEKTEVPISDGTLKTVLARLCDADGDGDISLSEALTLTVLDISETPENVTPETRGAEGYMEPIESLEGIEYFKNLTTFICNRTHFNGDAQKNPSLGTVDLSMNTKLETVECRNWWWGPSDGFRIILPKSVRYVDYSQSDHLISNFDWSASYPCLETLKLGYNNNAQSGSFSLGTMYTLHYLDMGRCDGDITIDIRGGFLGTGTDVLIIDRSSGSWMQNGESEYYTLTLLNGPAEINGSIQLKGYKM